MSETQTPSPTTATVRLVGGPDDWRGATLNHLSAEELAAPRESLGAYLVSTCVPKSHPDPGARAVYEPNLRPAPAHVWFFRGWVPAGPADAELRIADHHQAVDVTLDDDQLPTAWATDDGGRHRGLARTLDELTVGVLGWLARSARSDLEALALVAHAALSRTGANRTPVISR